MTAKFLKTYLWAFVAFVFIFAVGAMVFIDSYTSDGDSIPFSQHATVLIVFSLPALISLAAFVLAKIVNFKSAKLFRFKISTIAIDFAIILAFMITAVIYIKIRENVLLSDVIDFKNLNFLLILLFTLLAAFPIILLKASLTNFKERIAELNWDKLSGKFFLIFYLATLLLSTISIIVAFIVYDCNYYDFSDFSRAIYSAIFCFTITVALSAFLSAAADFLGKHTKSISILLLIVFLGVFIFGSVLYLALSVHGTSRNFSVCHYYGADYDGYYNDESYNDDEEYAVEEAYMPDYDEEEDIYQGLDQYNKLGFLWNNFEDDADNVKAAIKFGLREYDFEYIPSYSFDLLTVRYQRSEYEGKKGGLAYYRIIKYVHKYRTYFSLMALSNAYWDQIIENIPEKIYKKKKLDEFVYMLRWAYLQLYNEEYDDPYMNFHSVYNIMDKVGLPNIYEYYPLIRHFVPEKELPSLMRNSEGEINEYLVVWAYSFWGRRSNDGIASEVYQIIDKLYKNYSTD